MKGHWVDDVEPIEHRPVMCIMADGMYRLLRWYSAGFWYEGDIEGDEAEYYWWEALGRDYVGPANSVVSWWEDDKHQRFTRHGIMPPKT